VDPVGFGQDPDQYPDPDAFRSASGSGLKPDSYIYTNIFTKYVHNGFLKAFQGNYL
jgi:hypothetical protein